MGKSKFQLILIFVFVACAFIGLAIFAGLIKLPAKSTKGVPGATGSVVMWGTIPQVMLSKPLEVFNQTNQSFKLSYVEKRPETFDADIIEALAEGTGPDLMLLPQDSLYRFRNTVFPIPYTTYLPETFRATFITQADVLMATKGYMGLPLFTDPMIMYYNPTLLETNGIPLPPTTWAQFLTLAPQITKKTTGGVVSRSAVALGEFSNIDHSKGILSTLFIQNGNKIVTLENDFYRPQFSSNLSQSAAALAFYTQFADPTKAVYSWNKSLPSSLDMFTAGDLAFYFGYASDLSLISNKNPNLRFYIAKMPQPEGAATNLTFGNLTSVVISKTSKNLNTAYVAASLMTSGTFAEQLATNLNLPPVRRTLLAQKPTNTYGPLLYDHALWSRSWIDPDKTKTDAIWAQMVKDVTSGRSSVTASVSFADSQMSGILNN